MSKPKAGNPYYDRFTRLFDSGALVELSATQLRALWGFTADTWDNGISSPGFEAMMRGTGMSRTHLAKVTGELVKAGRIDRVSTGHKGHRAEYRIALPSAVTLSDDSVTESTPQGDDLDPIALPNEAHSVTLRSHPSSINTNLNTNNTNNGSEDAVAGDIYSEEEKAQSFASLRGVSVDPDVATEIACKLRPSVVESIIFGVRKGRDIHNPAGLVVKKCKAEIETGAIGSEIDAKDAQAAQAQEARQLKQAGEEAEEQRKATERQRLDELAAVWIKTIGEEEISQLSEGLCDAFPFKVETNQDHPAFARWIYQFSKDPKMQKQAADFKAVRDFRAQKAGAA